MPAAAAAPTSSTAPPTRRLVLLPHERRRADRSESGPRRYRLARLEATDAARGERFAHLRRSYD